MAESSGWPEDFSLRAAKLGDFDFARRLYLDGAHRHLAKIGRWNLRRVGSKFRQGYRQHQAQIICVDGKGVGFIQIAEFICASFISWRAIGAAESAAGWSRICCGAPPVSADR